MSTTRSRSPSPPPSALRTPRWPGRLCELHDVLRRESGRGIHEKALQEAWILIHGAVFRYLGAHASTLGSAPREDLEDLASEKSLDLVRRIESGSWDLSGRDPGEVAGFLSTVARNGLVDLFRKKGKMTAVEDDADLPDVPRDASPEPPEAAVERRAFAGALRDCAGELSGRDRTVWFFRVFYDLSSKEIARHPEVRLKAPHVDVILQRCRNAVRECMDGKGYRPEDVLPGTFAELWSTFRMSRTPGGAR